MFGTANEKAECVERTREVLPVRKYADGTEATHATIAQDVEQFLASGRVPDTRASVPLEFIRREGATPGDNRRTHADPVRRPGSEFDSERNRAKRRGLKFYQTDIPCQVRPPEQSLCDQRGVRGVSGGVSAEGEGCGMNTPNHIRVWRFRDAPLELSNLSTHGGDEDWLALIPPLLVGEWIPWMESGRAGFGVCDVSTHQHPELPGYEIRIGAHA